MGRPRANPVEDKQIIDAYAASRSITKVAASLGIGATTVHRALNRAGVELVGLEEYRKTMGRPKEGPYIGVYQGSDQEIIDWYKSGLSMRAIAEKIGRSTHVVLNRVRKAGIARPYQGSGPDHSMWKGGTVDAGAGYLHTWVADDDPFACMRNNHGYVLEHRLVLARKLGRPLKKTETVHHINGDTKDNRPENLQLRHGKHGAGIAPVCLDCGSHNIGTRKLE